MKKVILLDISNQSFWKMSESFKNGMKEALKDIAEVKIVEKVGNDLSDFKDAHAIIGFPFSAPLIRGNGNLKWVHFLTAQVPLSWQKLKDGPVITNSSVSTPIVAEHGLYLALKGIRNEKFHESHRTWSPDHFGISKDAGSLKALVVGWGKIGERICDLGIPLFKEVHLLSHRQDKKEKVIQHNYSDYPNLLKEMDVIFLCTSLNPESESQFKNGSLFGNLKKDAVLVNVGRGEILDEEEIISFFGKNPEAKYLTDVTVPEPYPQDGKLFTLPNIFVAPHIGARFEGIWDKFLIEAKEKLKGKL